MSNLLRFNVGAVTLRAEQAEGEQDDPKGVRVSIEAYNGGTMTVGSFGDVLVDVQGVKCGGQTPLLADHDSSLGGVVGFVQVAATGGKITATGYVVPETDAARQIVALAKAGFEFQASIGLEPEEREFVRPGDMAQANGMQVRAGGKGLTVVRAGNLKEISILPLGADSTTRVDIAAALNKDTLNMSDTEEIIRAERERIKTICGGKHPELQARAIAHNWTTERTELAVLRAERDARELETLRATRTSVHTPGTAGNPALLAAVTTPTALLEAGLLKRLGHASLAEKVYGAQTMYAVDKSGIGSAADLCRACLSMEGKSVPTDRDEMIRAAFSTISLPTTLSNVANKSLLESYQQSPATWATFAAVKPAQDFKDHKSIRIMDVAGLETLSPAGEIQHGTLREDVFTWRVETFAKLLQITRQMLVNDDLSALAAVPQGFGRTAARKVSDLVWHAVMETADFFTVGNDNYLTGASSALSAESLATAIRMIRTKVDVDGANLDLQPKVLVVPPELEVTAKALLESEFIQQVSTTGGPMGNPLKSRVELAVEPRISNTTTVDGVARFPNASAKRWYLFCGPQDVPVIAAFLGGNQGPQIEFNNQPSFGTLGVGIRCWIDAGAAMADWRCAVMSDGE